MTPLIVDFHFNDNDFRKDSKEQTPGTGWPRENSGRCRNHAATGLRTPKSPDRRRGRENSPQKSGGRTILPHFDFELLVPRMFKEQMSAVLSHRLWSLMAIALDTSSKGRGKEETDEPSYLAYPGHRGDGSVREGLWLPHI